MALTYDQKSEIRMAFDEAFVPGDRRRSLRVEHRVDAEICRWTGDRQGDAFRVRITDFSPTGIGLIHPTSMEIGAEYLIKIPRHYAAELVVLISVVRCVQHPDGSYQVGMELSSVMDRTNMGELVDALKVRRRVTSRRTKKLLMLFGIVGIGTSLLIQ